MKPIILTIALLCSFVFTACGENPLNNGEDSTLCQSSTISNDSLDNAQNALVDDESNQESETETNSSDTPIIYLILSISGFIGLLVALWDFYCVNDFHKEFSKRLGYLDKKLNEIDFSVNNLVSKSKDKDVAYHPSNEKSEILELKQKIDTLSKNLNTIMKYSSQTVPVSVKSSKKEEEIHYLSNPIGKETKYFTEILPSKSEKAYFRIIVKNENEASFELLELQKIKSADWFESVVMTKGVAMDSATSFETIDKGRLVKTDGYWRVEKPTEIKLKK